MKPKLSPKMTEAQFERGYWYALELKEFATQLGVPSANRLRKDELEKAIKSFLRSGKIVSPAKGPRRMSGIKDVEKGLSLKLPVVHYTSNKETKDFIARESLKIVPDLKTRSGVKYWMNRWREEQLNQGIQITYKDLVNQYIRLNQSEESFAKIPSVRYLTFLSEFLASEKEATRESALKAWKELKGLDIPKNYQAWKKYHLSK
jgi:hypothetical protein